MKFKAEILLNDISQMDIEGVQDSVGRLMCHFCCFWDIECVVSYFFYYADEIDEMRGKRSFGVRILMQKELKDIRKYHHFASYLCSIFQLLQVDDPSFRDSEFHLLET